MAKRKTTIEVGYNFSNNTDYYVTELCEFKDCIDKLIKFLESYHYKILNSYMTNRKTYIITVKDMVPDFLLEYAVNDYISDSKFVVIHKDDPL